MTTLSQASACGVLESCESGLGLELDELLRAGNSVCFVPSSLSQTQGRGAQEAPAE